jgi:hypothetical protein
LIEFDGILGDVHDGKGSVSRPMNFRSYTVPLTVFNKPDTGNGVSPGIRIKPCHYAAGFFLDIQPDHSIEFIKDHGLNLYACGLIAHARFDQHEFKHSLVL